MWNIESPYRQGVLLPNTQVQDKILGLQEIKPNNFLNVLINIHDPKIDPYRYIGKSQSLSRSP